MALEGRHRVGDVAGYLGVSTAAASKNIEKLRRFGLLLRRRSEWDRRAKVLSVSPKGLRLIRRYEEHKNARLVRTLHGFDTTEIDQLTGLLERFAVSLLETEPDTNGACLRCGGYLDDSCPVGHLRDGCPHLKNREARLGGAQ
jgi:DNA-binding MarR family transcriptional regulator